ncbi:MAG: hypothetical protein CME63_02240 [Halobacteriovoraceae bacterium]|nr:hypothetical protein [Halobacteriovoraceae bacterium]MBC96539.1 hypothetical protein [Halobacteriovoraceae bacterium]|tara:strand:- start:146251 stop:147180 length:930 start_codon:yes stop_codon:yes gene_type:complete
MKARSLILSLFILLFSCGKEADEVRSAIEEAHFLLTEKNCSQAKEVLDEIGYQATNADYIGAYASMYGCLAGYSTITFFADDIDQLSADQNGLMGSLTLFSTSDDMTSPTDPDFTNLQLAISTILYAGNQSSSSSANRETVFNIRDNTNLNVQAMYMILVNLGRWLKFYGNPDVTGEKGAGPDSNTCLFTYTDGDALLALSAGETGNCTNVNNTGSSDMMTGDPVEEKTRLCQGIVMFTNFIDLLANVEFSGDQAGDLSDIGDTFEEACDDIATAGYPYCDMRDLSGCLARDIDDLQVFSVLLFESNYK